jgi:hypothetical protein
MYMCVYIYIYTHKLSETSKPPTCTQSPKVPPGHPMLLTSENTILAWLVGNISTRSRGYTLPPHCIPSLQDSSSSSYCRHWLPSSASRLHLVPLLTGVSMSSSFSNLNTVAKYISVILLSPLADRTPNATCETARARYVPDVPCGRCAVTIKGNEYPRGILRRPTTLRTCLRK